MIKKHKTRILLTGGSGFIGSNLLKGLAEDYQIFTPTHKQLDIKDSRAVRGYIKKNKIRIVVHTAVRPGDQVLEDILRMYMSISNSLDLLERFIDFGSGAAYAKTRNLKKVKEEELGKYIPQDNYGLGKLICSQLSKGNKKIVTLHPFGIFGPGEDYQYKFISNAIVKNILGLPIKIKQNVVFDYLYIDDLIPLIKFFLNNKKYFGDYNVTTTKPISLVKIVQIINKISKSKSEITVCNEDLNFQYTGSNTKLTKTIPSLRISSYEEAIKNLYSFYSKDIAALDRSAIIQDNYFNKSRIKNNVNT